MIAVLVTSFPFFAKNAQSAHLTVSTSRSAKSIITGEGEVVQSPDERLTKEVLRVIRSSKGKWTPRKVRGVPQRTAYEYRVNYHNN